MRSRRATRHQVLDTRGLPNPEPVLRLADAANRLAPGQFLDVLTDDPCAPADFLRWSEGWGDVHLLDIQYLKRGVACAVFRRGRWASAPAA